jgi:hypothetical protein
MRHSSVRLPRRPFFAIALAVLAAACATQLAAAAHEQYFPVQLVNVATPTRTIATA